MLEIFAVFPAGRNQGSATTKTPDSDADPGPPQTMPKILHQLRTRVNTQTQVTISFWSAVATRDLTPHRTATIVIITASENGRCKVPEMAPVYPDHILLMAPRAELRYSYDVAWIPGLSVA